MYGFMRFVSDTQGEQGGLSARTEGVYIVTETHVRVSVVISLDCYFVVGSSADEMI